MHPQYNCNASSVNVYNVIWFGIKFIELTSWLSIDEAAIQCYSVHGGTQSFSEVMFYESPPLRGWSQPSKQNKNKTKQEKCHPLNPLVTKRPPILNGAQQLEVNQFVLFFLFFKAYTDTNLGDKSRQQLIGLLFSGALRIQVQWMLLTDKMSD